MYTSIQSCLHIYIKHRVNIFEYWNALLGFVSRVHGTQGSLVPRQFLGKIIPEMFSPWVKRAIPACAVMITAEKKSV